MTEFNMRNDGPLSHIQRALSERPPTYEERQIHRQVCIEGRFAHQVAASRGLSVERVARIVRRTRRWFAPGVTTTDSRRVCMLHLERLEHQWREVMTAWYRSGQQEETVKVSYEGVERQAGEKESTSATSRSANNKQKVERTTRGPCGDVRYLEQARRIMNDYRALCQSIASMKVEEWPDVESLTLADRAGETATHITDIRARRRAQQGRRAD